MKRRIGIMIGYNGKDFYGSNYNHEFEAVENIIVEALFEMGVLKESNYKDPNKIGLKSVSRTDKGVHAVLNVLTVKVEIEAHDFDTDLLRSLVSNKKIHVYKVIKVKKNFCPKNSCSSRMYGYIIPTFIFQYSLRNNFQLLENQKSYDNIHEHKNKVNITQIKETNDQKTNTTIENGILNDKTDTQIKNPNITERKEGEDDQHGNEFHESKIFDDKTDTFTADKNNSIDFLINNLEALNQNEIDFGYKIDDNSLDSLKYIFKLFEGTHNYKNFTNKNSESGKYRHIKVFQIEEKIIHQKREYLKIKIQGDSFMLHQIRKMIGFAVSIFLFKKNQDEFLEAFKVATNKKTEFLNIPKTPGQFLYLIQPIFEFYNKNTQYEKLEVDEKEMEAYRASCVFEEILNVENIESYVYWLKIYKLHKDSYVYLWEKNDEDQ